VFNAFYLKLYLLTVPVFFIVDLFWLGVVARSFYRRELGFVLGDKVNWAAAVVFYLIYIIGILFFAVRPALLHASWRQAAVLGALYGFFTYATYDLTNMATIDGWPLKIVIIDICWGILLCTLVSLASFAIAVKISM
jgi:uncharacterized membrane protein